MPDDHRGRHRHSRVRIGGSGVYTELQCSSYIFMDADYGRDLDRDGPRPRPSGSLYPMTVARHGAADSSRPQRAPPKLLEIHRLASIGTACFISPSDEPFVPERLAA
jgi:hypothetical protein